MVSIHGKEVVRVKKLMTVLLFGLVTISLMACGSKHTALSKSTDTTSSESEKSENKRKDTVAVKYEVGDIILADGSLIKEKDLSDVDDKNLPIAVIADVKEDRLALGLGVHRSSSSLQWALNGTTGEQTKFTDIVCTLKDPDNEEADTVVFTGDTDGFNHWESICAVDAKGTKNAKKNYPAFHFVNTYAETYKLTGDYASGWYMPSIAEVCAVYRNRETINRSLQKIYEKDPSAAMDGLGTNWYWSSSQSESQDDYAWFVHYFNGYVSDCPKNFTNLHVLAVRRF